VKTRTLLLLAVTVGLVILVAGGVKLLLIAEDKPVHHLAVPSSAKVGDMTVNVRSVSVVAGTTLVAVELVGVDDPDGASTFVFGTGQATLQPEPPPAGHGTACTSTKAAVPTSCVLAFATDAHGVLGYDRAGTTLRWDIVGPIGG